MYKQRTNKRNNEHTINTARMETVAKNVYIATIIYVRVNTANAFCNYTKTIEKQKRYTMQDNLLEPYCKLEFHFC